MVGNPAGLENQLLTIFLLPSDSLIGAEENRAHVSPTNEYTWRARMKTTTVDKTFYFHGLCVRTLRLILAWDIDELYDSHINITIPAA